MDVRELTTETLEWDAFVRNAPDGTPFHLTAWKRAIEETYRHRAHYLMALSDGRLEGVLPLFAVRGLFGGKALISVPYGVYGGICAISAKARDALVEAATELARAQRASYIELRQRRDLGLDLPTKSLYFGFSRTISPRDEENLQAIPRKQRRMTRQGVKHGLHTDLGPEHFDDFYSIYADSVHRLGSPVFPRTLLRRILENFGKECDLLSVWHDNRMVAGVLTLYFEDQVLPYYGGATRDAFAYAVNDFMYWELMRSAARRGYRVFDFGRSREGTGPFHFKRHWGFDPVPLPYQYILFRGPELPNLSPSNPRVRLATRMWKQLPRSVATALGPSLTRYLP